MKNLFLSILLLVVFINTNGSVSSSLAPSDSVSTPDEEGVVLGTGGSVGGTGGSKKSSNTAPNPAGSPKETKN